MEKSEGEKWWLGLQTYENDGRFRWSDHSVLNYVSWALGRPHALSRDRKCVYLSADNGNDRQSQTPQAKAVTVTSICFPPNSEMVRSEVLL